MTHREEASEILAKHVSIATLNMWQQDEKKRLKTYITIDPGLIGCTKIADEPEF